MRPVLMILFILSVSLKAQAGCQVYAPIKEFSNSGYTLYFDFTNMLKDKNYLEVYSPELADFEIKLKGIEELGRLNKAVTTIELGSFSAEESVTCFTQFCGISDFAKSFNKSYRKLSRILPSCQ